MSSLPAEILQILATHSDAAVDYVAVFMFLNTVAGGHYEERYPEADIRASLRLLLDQGAVDAWQAGTCLPPETVLPGVTPCHFRLHAAL
ncbi:MAG TPA: hypothetical protein VMV31_09220 [Terriglobales bacterium]|nr:hypothetical protein [Terriglobales bacterium]